MRVNFGAHFCKGHGHYDTECPSCVTNVAYEHERARIVAWMRETYSTKDVHWTGCDPALPHYISTVLADLVERGEHLK